MKKSVFFTALAIGLATTAGAKEKPPLFVEASPIKDKPTVTLDPTKGYALLRSDAAVPLYLMKVPTTADRAAYQKLRAEALIEARGRYERKLAAYRREQPIAARTPGAVQPEKPVEPTDSNFDFTPLELLTAVGLGPLNRFAKAKELSTYLQELTPGTYRIYGFLSALPGTAPVGSCFCMGSLQFEAKAGEIADLGQVITKASGDQPEGDSSAPIDLGRATMFARADTPVDPRLVRFTVKPAAFRPIGKLPNYFGLTITRVPAMAGIMRYERDRIVDLTR